MLEAKNAKDSGHFPWVVASLIGVILRLGEKTTYWWQIKTDCITCKVVQENMFIKGGKEQTESGRVRGEDSFS